MAITNVPIINGPNYGGVIYGLNLQVNYSNSPSKLTIDIVNDSGEYSTPILNTQVSVSFGSFRFNGYVWSYNIKQNAQERILQVEIVDKSIILDQNYVLLWKRGLFNDMGEPKDIEKTIDLSDQTILVPIFNSDGTVDFKEEKLGKQTVTRTIYKAGNINGNIIYLGTENFPDSECDIPDTYYLFSDLQKLIGNIIGNSTFNAPENYKASHEGKLRDVLRAWSADCGYDFYWDYATDQLKFFNISQGIQVTPLNINNYPSLLEYSESSSMEGTFTQHAIAYTAYPKESLKTLSRSIEKVITTSLNPYPVSYFLKKNGSLQSLSLPQSEEGNSDDPGAAERNLWGGRYEEEFLAAAFLGYINQDLRDTYCAQYNFWPALGFGVCDTVGNKPSFNRDNIPILTAQQKTDVIAFLNNVSKKDIDELSSIDSSTLSNYNFLLGIKNDGLNETWKSIEQEILQSYGSVYRHGITGGSSFYCTSSSITQIDVSVDPEPSGIEPQSSDFKGRSIFRRSGTMTHSANQAADLLGLSSETNLEALQKIKIREFDIISSGLKDKLFPQTKGTTLFIVPKKELVSKIVGSFDVTLIRTFINDLETTIYDMAEESQNQKCDPFDESVKAGQCQDVKSEALEKEYERVGFNQENESDTPRYSGLISNIARGVTIKIFGKQLKIGGPSYGRYQAVINSSINVEQKSNFQNEQKIFFNSSGSTSVGSASSMDVIYDNVTDSDDEYRKQRKTSIPLARSISNLLPQTNYQYTFAGEPVGVSLTPSNGLSSLDISYSSDGFKTTIKFSSRPKERIPVDTFLRKIESQLNRRSFNAS